jgi:hypothetical protein
MGGEAYEIKKKNPLESRNQKGREREREREREEERLAWDTEDTMIFFLACVSISSLKLKPVNKNNPRSSNLFYIFLKHNNSTLFFSPRRNNNK